MKTMKKSKVIVPALGLLLLSTAASVTGTVAWFTANKTVTLTAGEFAVASTTGDLNATLTPGIGTQKSGSTENVAPKAKYQLSDASLDHNTKNVYYPRNNGARVDAHKHENAVAPLPTLQEADVKRQELTNVIKYSVFTWTWRFEYTQESTQEIGLILDAGSTVTRSTSKTGWEGFRIAFFSSSTATTPVAEKTVIWAAKRSKVSSASQGFDLQYVAGAGTLGTSGDATINKYTQENSASFGFVDNATNLSAVTDDTVAATAKAAPNYLGTLGNKDEATGKVTLDVYCVAWFEGTDPAVATTTEGVYDSVTASMVFSAVTLA